MAADGRTDLLTRRINEPPLKHMIREESRLNYQQYLSNNFFSKKLLHNT